MMLSVPSVPSFRVDPGPVGPAVVQVSHRSAQRRRTGWDKRRHHAKEAAEALRQARGHDVLILCTVGIEAYAAPAARRRVKADVALVVADFLAPRPSVADPLFAASLRRVEHFVVIRSADRDLLRSRFGVSSDRISFAPFPAPDDLLSWEPTDGDYVYSAGIAHRDWETLLAAVRTTEWPAVLAGRWDPQHVKAVPARIQHLPLPDPHQGRLLMRDAGVVALSMYETDLPSGPLVLLDALALGKPVVVTDVAGSRDYVIDGVTGLLVPPGDKGAFADALARLRASPSLRERLGTAARQWAREADGAPAFVASLVSAGELAGARRRAKRPRLVRQRASLQPPFESAPWSTPQVGEPGVVVPEPGSVRLHLPGRVVVLESDDATTVDAVRHAWARCLSGRLEPSADDLVLPAEETRRLTSGDGQALAMRLTADAIAASRGRRLMFHAAGLADDDGRVVALVGPSGAGKTTAAARLGAAGFGYVTDELLVADFAGRVTPFPRPLFAHDPQSGGGSKRRRAPDDLGLGVCPADLRLSRLMLLSRSPDEPTEARLEPVPLIDGLLELIPQTSALAALDQPLQRLCRLADACGGVQRLVYTEIPDAREVVAASLGTPPAMADESWLDPGGRPQPDGSVAWGLMDGKVRRAPYRDAIRVAEEALLLVGDTPVRLAGIGLTIWLLAAEAPLLDLLVEKVVEEHGPHPEAEDLVRHAVTSLVAAKVVGYSPPRPLLRSLSEESLADLPVSPERSGSPDQ